MALTVPAQAAGRRLIDCLTELCPELAKPQLRALLEEGAFALDGRRAEAATVLAGGEWLTGRWRLRDPGGIEPEDLPLTVVYEDDALLVVDKPAGMAVHPSLGHWRGTLANAIVGHWWRRGEPAAHFGLVHRLDRDTSGLLVVGRQPAATRDLGRQLTDRRLRRTYLALVSGRPEPAEGRIDLALARDPHHRFRTVPDPAGRAAVTRYATLGTHAGVSLLRLELETGRTHQLRAHLAASGHPILGDALYGGGPGPAALARPALHAARLALIHPFSRQELTFTAPLPPELAAAASELAGSALT